MIRISIQLRQSLARLTLPVLIAAAFGTMLLGKADVVVVERARMGLADALAPIWSALQRPVAAARAAVRDLSDLAELRQENARLREENARLLGWQNLARTLEAENALLRRQVAFVPEGSPGFTTARVVADGGGTYARAVLLSAGPHHLVRKGQVALDDRGLVGRVTEVGSRSARVLLVTDMNSRIPVMLEGNRARAIMVGNNGSRPRLLHWPPGTPPQEGDRVVTSAEANAFPTGLPIGVVRLTGTGAPEVELFARLDRLEMLRLFDYAVNGLPSPDPPPARPDPRGKK
ncbi:rod shape-determining protein MreC [Roseicella aquatilis]|uniref:Cell shape-determining protein MreC n=1 Tax=Roseicella aquatilis TaxID=2527868 RepID=A0A4R4DHP5_9PROT|nr:rod shape-determining protein MreC [Roseicella aquatilis]TCZ59892.1 rod shape-determining protein MreC [Roseicella aquatilis]